MEAGAPPDPPPAPPEDVLGWHNLRCVIHRGDRRRERTILSGTSGIARPGEAPRRPRSFGIGQDQSDDRPRRQAQARRRWTTKGPRAKARHGRSRRRRHLRRRTLPRGPSPRQRARPPQLHRTRSEILQQPHRAGDADARREPARRRVRRRRRRPRVGSRRVRRYPRGRRHRRQGGSGISGGERRRLTIACETLSLRCSGAPHPKRRTRRSARAGARKATGRVILADEPTTGLDAHAADKIVEKLAETAREERAVVVAVLHQRDRHDFPKARRPPAAGRRRQGRVLRPGVRRRSPTSRRPTRVTAARRTTTRRSFSSTSSRLTATAARAQRRRTYAGRRDLPRVGLHAANARRTNRSLLGYVRTAATHRAVTHRAVTHRAVTHRARGRWRRGFPYHDNSRGRFVSLRFSRGSRVAADQNGRLGCA